MEMWLLLDLLIVPWQADSVVTKIDFLESGVRFTVHMLEYESPFKPAAAEAEDEAAEAKTTEAKAALAEQSKIVVVKVRWHAWHVASPVVVSTVPSVHRPALVPARSRLRLTALRAIYWLIPAPACGR